MLRVAVVDLFCPGGDYKLGCRLLRKAARRRCHVAVYLWSLTLIAHHGNVKTNLEEIALQKWVGFYTE